MSTTARNGQSSPELHLHRAPQVAVITDARAASSLEVSSRVRRYTVVMAFRMACFVGMIFVDGWLRWLLLAFAVFLPYLAVLFANQADQRTPESEFEGGVPVDVPQLTVGPPSEVIPGSLVEDDEVSARRAA